MPLKKQESLRKKLIVFFITDNSISMKGDNIDAINSAIEESIRAIREISEANSGMEIKIAALSYSFGAKWLTKEGPVSSEDENFIWNNPVSAAGAADFGSACRALNEKLSANGFMEQEGGCFPPVIILICGNEPSDKWESSLETLKQNNWFNAGIKFSVAAGANVDLDALKIFSSGMESVLIAFNADMLKKTIKFISVRSSLKAGGTEGNFDNKTLQQEITREFMESIAANSGDFTKCGSGHIYTTELDECPYCGGKTLDQALKEKSASGLKRRKQLLDSAMCYAPSVNFYINGKNGKHE